MRLQGASSWAELRSIYEKVQCRTSEVRKSAFHDSCLRRGEVREIVNILCILTATKKHMVSPRFSFPKMSLLNIGGVFHRMTIPRLLSKDSCFQF